MTSNIGSEFLSDSGKMDIIKNKELILNALRGYFRPEFINRVDDIIIFQYLEKEQIKDIVDIQIKNLNKILSEHGIQLQLTEKAKEFLSDKGFDPNFGARPLKRAIQTYIQNPLSLRILEGDFKENDIVQVDVNKKDELKFDKIS